MNDELKRQEHVLDAVTDHTDRTGYEIQHVSAQARKDFKVRPKRESSTHWLPSTDALTVMSKTTLRSIQDSAFHL